MAQEVREELQWWIISVKLFNGKFLVTAQLQIKLASDVLKKGLGTFCQEHGAGKLLSKLKAKNIQTF